MCIFCNDLKEIKSVNKLPEFHINDKKIYYRVSLVEVLFANGQKRGTVSYKARPFKYCPECGKKM